MALKLLAIAALALLCAHSDASRGKCRGFRANPSVYNFELGGRPAKVISDGRLLFEVEGAYDEPGDMVRRAFRRNFQADSPIAFENNILYLDLRDRKVLFNTGNSFLASGGTSGFLFDTLNVEGIDRHSITDIFIDHAHFDHIGGLLLPDGKTRAFPKATVHISRAEWDFWLADNVNLDSMPLPDASKQFLIDSAKTVLPKVRDQVRFFDGAASLLGGRVQGVPTTWHTPGHTSFRININGDELLYTGDAIGIESTSVNNPWFRLRFDLKGDAGADGRVKFLDRLATDRTRVMVFHGSFPGLGRIVTNDLSFDWKPENWEFSPVVRVRCPARK